MNITLSKLTSAFFVAGLLSACGGGGSGEQGSGPSAPSATIAFPPSQSLTNDNTMTVRGSAQDADGSTITSVQVNGADVETNDGFATWQITVPLALGENSLVVSTQDAEGNIDNAAASAVVHARPLPFLKNVAESGLIVDTANNRALVMDNTQDALMAFDLSSGERTVISSTRGLDQFENQVAKGSGENFIFAQFPVLDSENQRVLMMEKLNRSFTHDGIFAVDLNTGERSIVFDENQPGGSGPTITLLRALQLDPDRNRFVIMEGVNTKLRLLSMNRDTAVRSLLSGNARGSGPTFTSLDAFALDADNNRAFATTHSDNGILILEVDLDTGNRTITSGFDADSETLIGSGPTLSNPKSIEFNPLSGQLLIADNSLNALFLVDVDTGDRIQLDGDGAPFVRLAAAEFLGNHQAVAVDSLLETPVIVDLSTGDRTLLPNNAIGSGPRFQDPHAFAIQNNRLLVSDGESGRLFSVDRENGDRTPLLNDASRFNLQGMTSDDTNKRSFVINTLGEAPQLMAFDANNDTLTEISGPSVGSGPALVDPQEIVFNSQLNRILLVDRGLQALVSINPQNGERTVLSDNNSDGVDFDFPTALAVNAAGTQAFVADAFLSVLFSVDLNTGSRTIISGENPDTQEVIDNEFGLIGASSMVLDEVNHRVFISTVGSESGPIVSIDLANGEQTQLPDFSLSGVKVFEVADLILDQENKRLLALNPNQRSVIVVDLVTEERVVVSWTDISSF